MKALLMILVFLNGEPAGQFTPVPVENMTECVRAFDSIGRSVREAIPDEAVMRALCVTVDEVKELV